MTNLLPCHYTSLISAVIIPCHNEVLHELSNHMAMLTNHTSTIVPNYRSELYIIKRPGFMASCRQTKRKELTLERRLVSHALQRIRDVTTTHEPRLPNEQNNNRY